MTKKLAIIFAFAFLVRLIALNQSLWLDEATSARVVSQYSYTDIIQKFSPADFHPPLYYELLKLWTNIFGPSEVSLRFPSIILSLLTGYVIYIIGKKLKNESTGIWAAIFFLYNPLIVYYSQEARMYMMATFFMTMALYFFITLLKKFHRKYVFLFNIFTSLSFLTFYGSVFLIVSFYIYILYKKKFNLFFLLLPGFILSLLLVSPLLYLQLMNAKKSLSLVLNWKQVLGQANFKNLFLIPIKFSFGRISFSPKLIYFIFAGGWTIFNFIFVIKAGLKNKILLFLLVFPIFLGFLLSFFTPLLQYFRFLYLIPILAILMSIGLFNRIFKYVVLTGFLLLICIYLFFSHFHREDWKSLAYSLPSHQPVFMVSSSADPIWYYRKDIKVIDIRLLPITSPNSTNIIVIPYTSDIYGFNYATVLEKAGYTKKVVRFFNELTDELWRR